MKPSYQMVTTTSLVEFHFVSVIMEKVVISIEQTGVQNMPKDRSNKVSCNNYRCEIEVSLELISRKWKALILWELGKQESIRFNEFRRIIPGITQKMLTQQLRQLEEDDLIKRKVFNQVPPIVEYSLSQSGTKLLPILRSLNDYGKEYIEEHRS